MSTTVPLCGVLNEDLGVIYALFGAYHSDRTRFMAHFDLFMNTSAQDSKETPQSPSSEISEERPKVHRTLHRVILHECTCGKCYNLFARNDRAPWRRLEGNTFVNARHGKIIVDSSCPVSNCDLSGFIYDGSFTTVTSQPTASLASSRPSRTSLANSEIEERKMALQEKKLQMEIDARTAKYQAQELKNREKQEAKENKIKAEKKQLELLKQQSDQTDPVQKDKIIKLESKYGTPVVNRNTTSGPTELVKAHKQSVRKYKKEVEEAYPKEQRDKDTKDRIAEKVMELRGRGLVIVDEATAWYLEEHQLKATIKRGKQLKKDYPAEFERIRQGNCLRERKDRELWAVCQQRPNSFKTWF